MAELLIRDLEPELLQRLQQSAEEHGLSLEEEARRRLLGAYPHPERNRSKQEAAARMREIREQNAHLQKTNTLDLLHEGRMER